MRSKGKYDVGKPFLLLFIFIIFLFKISIAQKVISIQVKGGINPASADFIERAIEKATAENAACLVIHLNTPGGLLTSTRDIVSNLLKSNVPVVVYVSPTGAHAGSAGVFITMAGHIAAMAPGTNIGAAHPVSLQGKSDEVMNDKTTNDAAAFIRSISEKRGRNSEWAEDAVRHSVAITESEALENKVIDLIVPTEKELLNQIDGRRIEVANGFKILHTKGATVQILEMGFFLKVLNFISDPNIAYLLMMFGFFGILFELFNPGSIFPGIVGVISLILAFYALSSLPVNYAGVALIVFAIILFLLEVKIISHGLLAIGGIISLLLGSLFLFRSSPTQHIVAVSWTVIIATTVVTALFFLFVIGLGLKAQQTKPALGISAMIGRKGTALQELNLSGQISLAGEIWNAISIGGKIEVNEEVIVTDMKNLTVYVERDSRAT